jgi:hypothetical protein
MATSIPARIAGIDDKVGSIQKGLFADLFLLRGDTRHPFDSLIQASSKDVELVLVNGVPIYGDPKLMNAFSVKTESLVICSEGKSLNLDVMTNGKLSDVQTRMIAKLAKYGRTLAKLDDCDK